MSDNNVKDSKVFKTIEDGAIPAQLRDFPGARYILISKADPKKKKPKEKGFLVDKNYAANDPKLLGHILGGGNYGIATGFGGLHCLDADEYGRLVEIGVIERIPKTFTVRTGRTSSEGRHYWLKITGLQKRIIFYDTELKDPNHTDQALHLGEVQSKGNYAIGPGSIHKSGKKYEIIDDSPIAEITYEQLMEIIKPMSLHKSDDRPKQERYNRVGGHSHEEVDIERIGWPTGKITKYKGAAGGIEYKGSHPFHGSTSGENFEINPSKGVWRCYRCHSGGGWKELLAVREGIITCKQAGPKCLSKAQYREVMQRAEELGLIEERVIDAPITEIHLETEELETIPRETPGGEMIVLIAPPRTGKTHSVVQWLADNGSGNYITHTHAIVEHAVKIARELHMRGVVWMIGMKQPGACIQHHAIGNCKKCPLQNTQENFYKNERIAAALLHEKRILTAADIPHGMCPYYTLKAAEKHARYCFTVVNNINKIIGRDVTILDEEPVLSHFYAGSIEVATIKASAGETSTKNFIARSKTLQYEMDQIINHRKKPNLREYADKLSEISKIIDNGIDNGEGAAAIADKIEDSLLAFTPVHREVREQGGDSDDGELSMETCVRCLGNIYRENPVHVMPKTGGYYSIYILGDERKTSYAMDWINKTRKVIIIGATKAELFAKEFGGRKIVIPKFRYDERFLVIGVNKEKEGTDRGAGAAQKKMVIEAAKVMWQSAEGEKRSPFLVLTGSKKEQARAAGLLCGATEARDEREGAMQSEFISGKPVVIFQNSVISRGLDVDQYNLMFVYGCNFAQPFWAVADKGIAAAIISDETTNSVLRISSTLRNDARQLKVVVMRKDDLNKVKYIDRKIIVSIDSTKLGTILKKMHLTGTVKRNGRESLTVTDSGIIFDSGLNRFYELLEQYSESGNVYDDEMVLSAKYAIQHLLYSLRRKQYKYITTHQLISKLSKTMEKDLVKLALEQLYYKKEIQCEKAGNGLKWAAFEYRGRKKKI